MKVRVAEGHDLSESDRSAWTRIQNDAPAFSSPYFSPRYTAIVAGVRRDVYVGVLEQGNRPAGYFPFQLRGKYCGEPAGGPLSNCEGLVAAADCEWSVQETLRECGLRQWEYHHLLANQQQFRPYHAVYWPSFAIDVREYRWRSLDKLRRRLERDAGPLRFESHSADAAILRKVLAWKSAQYLRTGYEDRFSARWVVEVIERIHLTQEVDFAGMLSALFAGDRLIAAHMGMRSRRVWHYWYPGYDCAFARYSPGLLLLMEMAHCAGQLGLEAIDLGKGDASYKRRFATTTACVAEGVALA